MRVLQADTMSFVGLDVRVITLNDAFDVMPLKTLLPGADVRVQPAVDFRRVPPMALAKAQVVAPSGFATLQGGRKWHFELNSAAGVGLVQSVRVALEESDRPLLLLEDDFVIADQVRWVRECKTLLTHLDAFDVASFGATFLGSRSGLSPARFMGDDAWNFAQGHFTFTHCVMYSPRGRGIVRRRLRDQPLDMQLDGLLGQLAEMDVLTVLLQLRRASATQRIHLSHIQTDACALCHIPASFEWSSTARVVSLLTGACLLLCLLRTGKLGALLRAGRFRPCSSRP